MVSKKEDCVIELINITKTFPGTVALDRVDFFLKKNEVHALVGENGAGKSTLIKILTGYYTKDSGEIRVWGNPVTIRDPHDALSLGIAAIYQEINLPLDLSVAENIFLGRLPKKNGFIYNKKKLVKETQAVLQRLGVRIDPETPVRNLNVGQCKLVEIAKAITRDIKILVMDEPTAALPQKEVNMLFKLISSLKRQGISIIYISHHLDEIFQVADRVTVLRNGKNVGELLAVEENRSQIIKYMVGRQIDEAYPKNEIDIKDELLRVESLTKKGIYEDISFSLRRGEILGIFGLIGSGHTQLLRSIVGDANPDSGNIIIMGNIKSINSPTVAHSEGIGLVPGDRKKEGMILSLSVEENITLGNQHSYCKYGIIQKKKKKKKASRWVEELTIKAHDLNQKVESLSGGNQQKVVIARLLESDADILLLDGPTVGVDVGAKTEIYKILENLCARGKGIILLSDDLMEILSITDNILVIKKGKMVKKLKSKSATKEELLQSAM